MDQRKKVKKSIFYTLLMLVGIAGYCWAYSSTLNNIHQSSVIDSLNNQIIDYERTQDSLINACDSLTSEVIDIKTAKDYIK